MGLLWDIVRSSSSREATPGENRNGSIAYNEYGEFIGDPQRNPATAKLQFNINGSQIINKSPVFNEDGLTHLLVLKFEMSTEAASDRVSLFYDPKTPIEPTASNFTEDFDFSLGAIGSMTAGPAGMPTVMDEIRFGTTFADVLPPNLPVPGDTNGDEEVDMLDYNAIIANMNMPGGLTLAKGDVTGDGQVTIADFRFWKERRSRPGRRRRELAGLPAWVCPSRRA